VTDDCVDVPDILSVMTFVHPGVCIGVGSGKYEVGAATVPGCGTDKFPPTSYLLGRCRAGRGPGISENGVDIGGDWNGFEDDSAQANGICIANVDPWPLADETMIWPPAIFTHRATIHR
jgi:hypothetical protein